MNSEDAKEILSAYRSGDRDRPDPIFREALEQVAGDNDLKKWFDQQREFDQSVRQKLATIEPPEELRARLLAQVKQGQPRRVPLPPPWLALAACLVLGGIGAFYTSQVTTPNRFQEFRTEALAMVSRQGGPILDLQTPKLSETQAFLREHQAPCYAEIPATLKSMETAGCRAFVWKEHPASLTCFHLPDGQFLHLVVIDRAAMGDADIVNGMKLVGDWHVMVQQKDGMVLMWASRAPMEELKRVFLTVSCEWRQYIKPA